MNMPKQFVLYKDVSGAWRWSLRAPNNRVIADSAEGYQNRLDAIHGARLVAGLATDASIWDSTSQQWVT